MSNVDRQRLTTAFQENRDWLALAENLGIKRTTAHNIINIFRRDGRAEAHQRGGSQKKVDNEMKELLVRKIEEKPSITLAELKRKLQEELPLKPPVSLQTISRALDSEFISFKNVRSIPVQWNQQDVKEERRQFMNWLMVEGVEKNLVFVDEFGVNLWTARTKGRAAVGQRAVRITAGQRGQNLTFCLAISPQYGFVHCTFVVGGFTHDKFGEMLGELGQLLFEEEVVILVDNARPHLNAPRMLEQHELRYLPRYSPIINAAEYAGSAVKAAVKRTLSEPAIRAEVEDRAAAAAAQQTLQQRRLQVLERELRAALPTLTEVKCRAFFNHILAYGPASLAMEDILD